MQLSQTAILHDVQFAVTGTDCNRFFAAFYTAGAATDGVQGCMPCLAHRDLPGERFPERQPVLLTQQITDLSAVFQILVFVAMYWPLHIDYSYLTSCVCKPTNVSYAQWFFRG